MELTVAMLRARVRRERRSTLILGAVFAVVLALLVVAPIGRSSSMIAIYVVRATLAAAAAYFFWEGLKSPDRHPGIRALAAGGQDVVWIYLRRVTHGRNHVGSRLRLGLVSGEIAELDIPKERDNEDLASLGRLVPHATVGYDPLIERRFRFNPSSLKRS